MVAIRSSTSGSQPDVKILIVKQSKSTLNVELEEPDGGEYFTMEMEAHDEDGAFYNVKDCPQYEGTIWLCNVVHEFFGNHPDRIYCSVIE